MFIWPGLVINAFLVTNNLLVLTRIFFLYWSFTGSRDDLIALSERQVYSVFPNLFWLMPISTSQIF